MDAALMSSQLNAVSPMLIMTSARGRTT